MKLKTFLGILLIAVMFVGFTNNSFAQRKGNYSHAITADPIGLAWGWFNATYEHQFGAINSFTVGGTYYNYGGGWSAFGIHAAVRWYPDVFKDNKRALEGFSAGPMISFGFWNYDDDYYKYDGGTSVAIGGQAAYKWVFSDFVVEPILTFTFNVANIDGLTYRPFGIGCNLGYAW